MDVEVLERLLYALAMYHQKALKPQPPTLRHNRIDQLERGDPALPALKSDLLQVQGKTIDGRLQTTQLNAAVLVGQKASWIMHSRLLRKRCPTIPST